MEVFITVGDEVLNLKNYSLNLEVYHTNCMFGFNVWEDFYLTQ